MLQSIFLLTVVLLDLGNQLIGRTRTIFLPGPADEAVKKSNQPQIKKYQPQINGGIRKYQPQINADDADQNT